jgi:hypothetical protein
MARPDEDQPNRTLPAAPPPEQTTQHWRVQVPKPATTLMLGQRVPALGNEAADGYPGVSLHTAAGCFVDVRERTVWQGHEVIAFQSLWNAELHAGHAVVLGATRWDESDTEPLAGDHVKRTHGQDQLYTQLREQLTWMDASKVAWETMGLVKSLITFDFGKAALFKAMGMAATTKGIGEVAIGLGMDVSSLAHLPIGSLEPAAGVHVTSHDGLFIGAGGATNMFSQGGFSMIAGPAGSFKVHAPIGATVAAGLTVEMFALATASVTAGYSSTVSAIMSASLVSKMGDAKVVGKTVSLGKIVHGPEVLKTAVNPAFLRPTSKLEMEAVETISAKTAPLGNIKFEAPLGEVSSVSRTAKIEAVDTVTLRTPFGTVEVSGKGISITSTGGGVIQVNMMGVTVTSAASSISVAPSGITASAGGATVSLMPGGIVKVSGTVVNLG